MAILCILTILDRITSLELKDRTPPRRNSTSSIELSRSPRSPNSFFHGVDSNSLRALDPPFLLKDSEDKSNDISKSRKRDGSLQPRPSNDSSKEHEEVEEPGGKESRCSTSSIAYSRIPPTAQSSRSIGSNSIRSAGSSASVDDNPLLSHGVAVHSDSGYNQNSSLLIDILDSNSSEVELGNFVELCAKDVIEELSTNERSSFDNIPLFTKDDSIISSFHRGEANQIRRSNQKKSFFIGNLLGKGAFSDVHAVSATKRTDDYKDLAMKSLRLEIKSDSDVQELVDGVNDIVNETVMLCFLNHRNIIKIHGWGLGNGYFILVDKLQDTLKDRIQRWKKMRWKKVSRLVEQHEVAKAVADVMTFLHERGILFRDLKPANIGFNEEGVLKLFDFGMAIKLDSEENLAYEVGSYRYMAPEVYDPPTPTSASGDSYGLPADVYSFSVLLWEIYSLKKPFGSPNKQEFVEEVFGKGKRPAMENSWPQEIKRLIEKGWSQDPKQRPSMEDCKETLENTSAPEAWQQHQRRTSFRASFRLSLSCRRSSSDGN